MILWRTFIFSQVETNSLIPGSNSTWYLLLSNGCNPSITFLGNSTPPWYVTINNYMHCVWGIFFLSKDQMHNKTLWTRFLFKHGSWCISFTCLIFCSCKMTSKTNEGLSCSFLDCWIWCWLIKKAKRNPHWTLR